MGIDLGSATNKGTALLKFAHQFQPNVILHDPYLGWFFDPAIAQALQENCLNLGIEPRDEAQQFQQIAYEYIIYREKYGDAVIKMATSLGCQQLLLLGAGYDTRFFRIAEIAEKGVITFEVDLPTTIEDKQACLIKQLGRLPDRLTLIPLDFNHDDLNRIFQYGFDPELDTVYVWQGVSYYLPQESVSQVLDFLRSQMTANSVLVFDACSPLMTYDNDQIPGIAASIQRLNEIGEPFVFGMEGSEMKVWLQAKGFQDVAILQQDDLEEIFVQQRTLPNNMWYIVTARV